MSKQAKQSDGYKLRKLQREHAELKQLFDKALDVIFQHELVDTEMLDLKIPSEFASKQDWIESKIHELSEK